jgi:hypothetical protein
MRRSTLIPLIVLGLGTGTACSAKADDSRAPAGVNAAATRAQPQRPSHPTACSLIGQEEMSQILGGRVGPPASEERGGTTTCTYTPAAGKGVTPYAQITIDWNAGEEAMAGMKLADRFLSKDAGFSITDKIDGVGDEASMMIGGVMNVRKGVLFMTIDLRMQPRAKDKGIAVARAILAKIDADAVAK